MISHQRLLEVLDYDPETGIFKWKISPQGKVPKGTIAGGCKKDVGTNTAYLQISVDKKPYYAHRLAWFYVHHVWPNGALDHINRNGLDNRIVNLRVATASQNASNSRRKKPAKSGLTGVRKRTRNCFEARINMAGHPKILGFFATAEEASKAYQCAFAKQYGDFLRG